MSSNTDNAPLIIDQPLIQTQNQEKPQNPEEKQEIPQMHQQIESKSPIHHDQQVLMQLQSDDGEKQEGSLRPQEEQKLIQQNSMQISSRIQNTVRNNFTPFSNQKVPSCHCKKSKCLKMYCECYAKGFLSLYSGNKCRETCKCIGCQNTKNLSKDKNPDCRNDEEVERSQDSNKKSIKPKQRACNCKKSFCLKKYCQCFNANQPCGQTCKCQECKNNGENNNSRQDKNQGSIPLIDSTLYNIAVNRQVSQVMSDGNGFQDRRQDEMSVKRRQKPDQDEIQTKISQILKLVPQQNYQTMLDFLAYYLS